MSKEMTRGYLNRKKIKENKIIMFIPLLNILKLILGKKRKISFLQKNIQL